MHLLTWPRKHKWLTLLTIVLLVIIAVFTYFKISLELNRRAFQQAAHAIETIYADIVKEIGPPDDNRYSRECSRPSVVYDQGPLSCSIGIDFIYGVSDKQEPDQLKERIKSVINHHSNLLLPTTAPPSFIDVNPAPGNNTDSTIDYFKTSAGMECTSKYTYDMPREIQLNTKNRNEKGFGISISCSSDARGQFFPMHAAS